MEKRTAEVIMILKGNHEYKVKYPGKSSAEYIAYYFSDYCQCPVKDYSKELILEILESVALDYLRSVRDLSVLAIYFESRRTRFFRLKNGSLKSEVIDSLIECWATALREIQIKDSSKGDYYFINGWSEELCQTVKIYDHVIFEEE